MTNKIRQNNIKRFMEAQKNTYESVLLELNNRRKTAHWIWFIFPVIIDADGAYSSVTQFYAIEDVVEAKSYLSHPILGCRLRECVRLLVDNYNENEAIIFLGKTDYKKLHTSMTLFAYASDDKELFIEALNKFFRGKSDTEAVELLR